MDTQTLTANNMAATAVLNYLAAWLYAQPLTTLGCHFSTFNTMHPIKIDLDDIVQQDRTARANRRQTYGDNYPAEGGLYLLSLKAQRG